MSISSHTCSLAIAALDSLRGVLFTVFVFMYDDVMGLRVCVLPSPVGFTYIALRIILLGCGQRTLVTVRAAILYNTSLDESHLNS